MLSIYGLIIEGDFNFHADDENDSEMLERVDILLFQSKTPHMLPKRLLHSLVTF